jgi:hypothetical protein
MDPVEIRHKKHGSVKIFSDYEVMGLLNNVSFHGGSVYGSIT